MLRYAIEGVAGDDCEVADEWDGLKGPVKSFELWHRLIAFMVAFINEDQTIYIHPINQ